MSAAGDSGHRFGGELITGGAANSLRTELPAPRRAVGAIPEQRRAVPELPLVPPPVAGDGGRNFGPLLSVSLFISFYNKGSEALEQVAQRGDGCPVHGDSQGKVGSGLGKPD